MTSCLLFSSRIKSLLLVVRAEFTKHEALDTFRLSRKNLIRFFLQFLAEIDLFSAWAKKAYLLKNVFILRRGTPGTFQKRHVLNLSLPVVNVISKVSYKGVAKGWDQGARPLPIEMLFQIFRLNFS